METNTYTIRKDGNTTIFEAETEYFIDLLANAFHSTKSRKEKAEIRDKYLNLVKAENAKRGFKCFNTVL